MKNTLTTLTALSILACTTTDLLAKPGKRARKAINGPDRENTLRGDASDFGALRDKFQAHQRLTNGGAKYYDKSDGVLRSEHSSIYNKIQHVAVEDRLTEEEAREAIDELFSIGEAHLADPENANTAKKLEDLKQKIRRLTEDLVPAEALTPKLNRLQFHLEEAVRFGEASGHLSTGELSSLRRKLDSLESKEDRAKDDEVISDREREKLIEHAREIWRDALKDFD